MTLGYRNHVLPNAFVKFFKSYSEFLSKFGAISSQEYVSYWISYPVICDDIVYKLRRIKGVATFISFRLKVIDDGRSSVWPFYSFV